MTRRLAALAWMVLATAGAAGAQPATPGGDPTAGVPTDPIRCWWRSSAGAVRIGEPFDVLLTCAVLDTDTITVVPDQTGLAPPVVQLPPFELLGGSHPADLHTDDRRFFQYRYELRLIVDDAFGQDVALPPLELAYRVRSRGPQGAVIEGRDQTYLMPSIAIRVLALVPNELTDIRDAGNGSFADLESRTLRGRILLVLGALFTLLGAIVAVVTAVRRPEHGDDRARAATPLLSDGEVLRGVARELASVRHDREAAGWTQAVVGRALAAVRIAAAFALSGRVSQSPAAAGDVEQEGELRVQGGWPGRRVARVSGWATPESIRRALSLRASHGPPQPDRARLESLADALAGLTRARFGREEPLSEAALDASLDRATDEVRRLEAEHRWPATMYRAVTRAVTRRGWHA